MTEKQKKKFQKKYNGWYPTEKQFQYGKKHCNFDKQKEQLFKKLDYLLSYPNVQKIWNSDILPLLEEIEIYDEIEKEYKELYGIK